MESWAGVRGRGEKILVEVPSLTSAALPGSINLAGNAFCKVKSASAGEKCHDIMQFFV